LILLKIIRAIAFINALGATARTNISTCKTQKFSL
jgi:hypothetical protein